jgi:hypothetical protein
MKTIKELADLGAAAAQKVMRDLNNPSRLAFAQAVKDEVEKEQADMASILARDNKDLIRQRQHLSQRVESLSKQLKYTEDDRNLWTRRAHEAESKVAQLQKQNDWLTGKAEQHKKPWTLPPPPEGQQWHRQDWTEEMLPERWRPLLLNEIRAVGDECLSINGWIPCNTGHRTVESVIHCRTRRPLPTSPDPYAELKAAKAAGKVIQIKTADGEWGVDLPNPSFAFPADQYRIKPEPVLVPLTMNDIRATDEFKHMESHIVETADHWNCQEVTLSWSGAPSYDVLAAFYLRRQHGSNEWKPCTKEKQ